jgi:hypothetical protein
MNFKDIIGPIIFIIISTLLFIILQPGSVFTLPGNTKWISFITRETNLKAIMVHGVLYGVAISGIMVIYYILIKPFVTVF